ncbi:MAG TPA: M3 family metallopeptidase, partial [Herpetosiphonaceae bacterium]|nr:M3 family metallopeptidase [Herpetosiphonaceae bacterium]
RLRRRLASNAGLPDYRAYRWRELNRLDYTPEDCLRLHAAIEVEIVPLSARLLAARRERLRLDTLRPWDLEAPLQERPLLNPFPDPDELASRMAGVYEALDPDLGAMFERMRDGFLDLGVRKGKASGSEEWVFPVSELAYVRVAVNATFDDVLLLLHESGHAFHDYLALKHNALIWDLYYPTEFSEFAAIAMSHLGLHQIERGGFGTSVDVAGARRAFLAGIVVKWLPEIALVDAFQHWIYADAPPEVDTAALNRKWAELSARFKPGVDWSGLEHELGSGWQQVGLLFGMPFYYVEYALAHLAALEVWQRARRDWSNAWHDYRSALALGATRPLPELFTAARTRLPFDPQVVRDTAALLAAELQAYPD